MHKENLPGYGQLNLYDNLIEYKGSFFNAILLDDSFPKLQANNWQDWKAKQKSNRAYLTYVFLKDPRHYRGILKQWYTENKSQIIFPFFIFCYCVSEEGKVFAERARFTRSTKTLWACRKYQEKEFIRLCGFLQSSS